MFINARAFVLTAVIVVVLSPTAVTHAQTPEKRPGFFERDELTGDWGEVRTKWKEKGFGLSASLTQFYQGIASGGARSGSEYNGTAQVELTFDFGKLAGWSHWSVDITGETRFGGPLLTGTGAISPVNTAIIIPGADGTVSAITTLTITKLVPINLKEGKLIAVSLGRFNLLETIQEQFFAGAGIERFMNIAQIGPLTVVREVPLITNFISVAYVNAGEPRFTFALMDPNDHSIDSGLSDLYADGVTFAPAIHFPVQWFGKSGKHSFSGAITTKEYTPFVPLRQIILPGPPLNPVEPEAGSWSVGYTVRQSIVERGTNDGWGLFAQLSFANESTSPITTFFDVGVGGNGLFSSRAGDEFGLAYAVAAVDRQPPGTAAGAASRGDRGNSGRAAAYCVLGQLPGFPRQTKT
jgi:porin